MMEQRSNTMRQGVPWRCLLVVPRGFDVPQDLMRCLYLRGFEVQTIHDEPSAMLELSRGDFLSLILHEPKALVNLDRLIAALGRFHPSVRLWRHETASAQRLSVWGQTEEPVAPAKDEAPEETAKPQVQTVSTPPLKLHRPAEPSPKPVTAAPGPMVDITDEELAMLLGELPGPVEDEL